MSTVLGLLIFAAMAGTVGWCLKGLMVERAEDTRERGPCANVCPPVFAGPTIWCRLAHGHLGDHISDEGTRWRENVDD